MVLKLKYGHAYTQAQYRLNSALMELKPRRVTSMQQPADLLARKLTKSIGAYPIQRLFRRARNLLIILPHDNWQGQACAALTALLAALRQAYVSDGEVKILLAGQRRTPLTQTQISEFIGAEIASRYPVFQHNMRDQAQLEYVGETLRGIPVFLNKHVLEADEIILCSPIASHPLLGYTGGPSVIAPDCAGEETIARLYAQAVNGNGVVCDRCADCSLESNPLQESIREALRFVSARFGFYVVFNHNQELVSAFSGDPFQAFAAGLETVDLLSRVEIERRAAVTIVSPGGAPHDNRFIDAIPALLRAVRATKPDGAVVLLAACENGFGYNGFHNFSPKDGSHIDETPDSNLNPEEKLTATLLTEYSRRNQIACVSQLSGRQVSLLGMSPYSSLQEALDAEWGKDSKPDLIYVIKEGAVTVPYFLPDQTKKIARS